MNLKSLELWFVTGSQHLYGPETLKKVAENSAQIASSLDETPAIPVKIVSKPVLTTPDAIYELCLEANASKNCIGLV
ncbi:MAG TPA: L-arabinose isomerase, partial [Terriglobales bacterium]